MKFNFSSAAVKRAPTLHTQHTIHNEQRSLQVRLREAWTLEPRCIDIRYSGSGAWLAGYVHTRTDGDSHPFACARCACVDAMGLDWAVSHGGELRYACYRTSDDARCTITLWRAGADIFGAGGASGTSAYHRGMYVSNRPSFILALTSSSHARAPVPTASEPLVTRAARAAMSKKKEKDVLCFCCFCSCYVVTRRARRDFRLVISVNGASGPGTGQE